MRKLPPVTRKRDYFSKKYVITLPVWSPLVLGFFILVGLVAQPKTVATIVCTTMALFSAIFCRIAWVHLKEMRYALHNALNDIDNDELDPAGLDDTIYEVPSA